MRVFILNLIIYRCADGAYEATPVAKVCTKCRLACATCTATATACLSCTATANSNRKTFADDATCGYSF